VATATAVAENSTIMSFPTSPINVSFHRLTFPPRPWPNPFHVLPQQQRTTVDGEFAAAAQHHSLSHPRQYTGSGGYQSSSDAGTYDQQDLWDPDDASMSGTSVASTDIGTEFSFITNKDEQSLLQHSLRNESYKMQRLRTPPPPSLKLLAETPIDNIDPATGKRILRGAGGEKLIL
jgi:hypothetical protein